MSAASAPLLGRRAPRLVPQPTSHAGWLTVAANLDPRFGGVSAVMGPLFRSLQRAGAAELSLAAFGSPGDDLDAILPEVGRAQRFGLTGLTSLAGAGKPAGLDEMVRQSAGVHIHGLWQEHCALAARAAQAHAKPYVISAHGMLDPWALRHKRLKKAAYLLLVERRSLRGAACLHALTSAEAEDYRRLAPGVPVAVIPNGVEAPASTGPEPFLARFPHLRGKNLVLFLGRIHYKKGLDILTGVWPEVSAAWPDAHLVLAGPDFEGTRTPLEQALSAAGISDRVTFTGMLAGPDKWSALAACGLFVLPSYSEGLSVSALEAMAMARPVLLSQQCHVEGIAQNGCGWQIEPRAADLAAALHGYFSVSGEAAEAMGRRGRELARRVYSWDTVGRHMCGLYRWLEGGSAPADLPLYA